MGRMTLVWIVLLYKYATMIDASIETAELDPSVEKNALLDEGSTDTENVLEDLRLQRLGHHLIEVLLHPDHSVPLIYVEEYPSADELSAGTEYLKQYPELQKQEGLTDIPFKRSRYYRKYPWKRQNSRETYDAENRYLCQPSREDVFRLLVALHEARQGNSRTVNFCNRKRPATSVFTNIRFLGRRK